MPVYQVKPKAARSPEPIRIVTADSPSQVARYLAKEFEITSLTPDEMVPFILEQRVRIENARPSANAPAEDGPDDPPEPPVYRHKPLCTASAFTPIGAPTCLCHRLDRVSE
jgi:hypothetical protein